MGILQLRSKILLAVLGISAGLTCGTLAVVRYIVENRVRESLGQELHTSVLTYRTIQSEHEASLARTAALLAGLPTVRALLSTQDAATIQDGSGEILKDSGADLLLLADRRGQVCAVQSGKSGIPANVAQALLNRTFEKGGNRDWWLADGRLYQVVVQPVEFGQRGQMSTIGVLVAGQEIDKKVAQQFKAVMASEVVFHAGGYDISSIPDRQVVSEIKPTALGVPFEIQLGNEHFLATSEKLYGDQSFELTLTVLKSFDAATAFVSSLNRVLVGLGLLAVFSGTALSYAISRSITRPLGRLVEGVNALKHGDFQFPLAPTSKDEVGVVTAAFNHLRQSLQQGQEEQKTLEQRLRQAHKMEAVGRLAGGVAHDFNNLLTIIRGHADLLLDWTEADREKKSIEQIQKASNRAVGMTRQLLAFSRMQVLDPRVLDLNSIISEMGKMLPRLIGEHIEYTFVPANDLYRVLADPGQIEQVLMNLAVNARDAMPGGGKLVVRTANVEITAEEAARKPGMLPGSYARISISDNGQGMDEETKSHIFEPFFTTKEVGKGTGLGLATVYGIVKQSRGFVWVESELGRGATFEIFLSNTSGVPEATPSIHPTTSSKRRTATILIAEDEAGVRDLAHQFLRAAGYRVLEARDGAEALEISARYTAPIDMLLTDMVMPKMSGKELAERLCEERPALRVLLMSGYSDFGGDDNVSSRFASMAKPFSMSSLVEKVDEVLHGAVMPQDALIT